MRLLLDTHVFLWTVVESSILNDSARRQIAAEGNLSFVSLISLWELEIKRSLGRLDLPERFYERLPGLGCEILPLTVTHIEAVGNLPLLHRDPFDRMLVAQAKSEQLTLVTRDKEMMRYDVSILKA